MIRWLLNIGLIGGMIALFAVGGVYLSRPDHFPLRAVEVHGSLHYVTREQISKILVGHLTKGFLRLNVGAVQGELKQLPWVAEAIVGRRWPDRLRVTLIEHKPLARFGDKGVMSAAGIVFYPGIPSTQLKEMLASLSMFRGNEFEARNLLQQYLMLLEQLKPVGLGITELTVLPHGAWEARLDNQVVILLGKTELYERIRRFVVAYRKMLQAKCEYIAYVDLRYANGLAVGWKTGKKPVEEGVTVH